jgi:hypothetical protein
MPAAQTDKNAAKADSAIFRMIFKTKLAPLRDQA